MKASFKFLISEKFLLNLIICLGIPLSGFADTVISTPKEESPVVTPDEDAQEEPFMGNLDSNVDANADELEFIGSNVVGKGNVRILYGSYLIQADRAIVNMNSRDIEARGNVRFYQRIVSERDLSEVEYNFLNKKVDVRIEFLGTATLATGEKKMRVRVTELKYTWECDHILGNLQTGIMKAKNFFCRDQAYFFRGEEATRDVDGSLNIKNADVSTCDHFPEKREHYKLSAGSVMLEPKQGWYPGSKPKGKDYRHYWTSLSDHIFFKIFDVPVFWLPRVVLPPLSELPRYCTIEAGKDSDWGYFLKLSKSFGVYESDRFQISTRPEFHYYSKRGVALADTTTVTSDNSWTELYVFGLRDRKPYGSDDSESDYISQNSRFKIPRDRYELRLRTIQHLTSRLDFRGQFDKLSDVQLLEDFFDERYDEDPVPATFASIDYQFERFIPSILVRPRVNDFVTTVESLPELRLDIPRQRLFGNLYWQGQNSLNWLHMRWREFDRHAIGRVSVDESENYHSARADTLNMFYYPIKLGWLNLIPRAGFRLTYYDRSSKSKVSFTQLQQNRILRTSGIKFNSNLYALAQLFDDDNVEYDHRGGSKLRFVGELGIEGNTKIYNSWQTVKSAFWQLDGLRHVIVPYFNYNFIPEPNVDRDNLYYFDGVDRLTEQNWLRVGIRNSLQTRRGPYYDESIVEWLSMENYFDLHFHREKGFKTMGDFGTIIRFCPSPNLTWTTQLLMDTGSSDFHDVNTFRGGQYINERKGIKQKYISNFNTSLVYKFADHFQVSGSYNYSDAYMQRTMYSMGSSIQEIVSGGLFPNYYTRSQTIQAGIEFPIIQDRTYAALDLYYDVELGFIRDVSARITHNIHCWDISLIVQRSYDYNEKFEKEAENRFLFTIGLSAYPDAQIKLR